MWDKIVQHPQDAKISLSNVFNKYMLVDQYDELRGTGNWQHQNVHSKTCVCTRLGGMTGHFL
jgi:hypothetical protein